MERSNGSSREINDGDDARRLEQAQRGVQKQAKEETSEELKEVSTADMFGSPGALSNVGGVLEEGTFPLGFDPTPLQQLNPGAGTEGFAGSHVPGESSPDVPAADPEAEEELGKKVMQEARCEVVAAAEMAAEVVDANVVSKESARCAFSYRQEVQPDIGAEAWESIYDRFCFQSRPDPDLDRCNR